MRADTDLLLQLIETELHRPADGLVSALAAQLAARGGAHTAAVLFYGSALRSATLEGILDFYVLLDKPSAWPGSSLAALGNRLLPPNVGYFEGEVAGHTLRAKYAVISAAQFARHMAPKTLDTTLWARFSQPCVCVWARSDADRAAAVEAVGAAVITAASWAAQLGPAAASAQEYWRALYARTYDSELRVERAGRSDAIVARDPERYGELLRLAWRSGGIPFDELPGGELAPRISEVVRDSAARRWRTRQRLGKPLNVLRLLKAAFTFEGAMDYVAWKIERHSGVRIVVSPWQRRFPLLAAPGLYWQLRRRGVLR